MLPSLHRHAVRVKLVIGYHMAVFVHPLASSVTPQPVAQQVAPLAAGLSATITSGRRRAFRA
jgi:hypothetical protein